MVIIVNILKIIGGLIALMILLMIAVFTIPVFYRADIDYDSKLNASIRLVFFLGLFIVYVGTSADKSIRFRVLGIPFRLKKRTKKDVPKAKKGSRKKTAASEQESTPQSFNTKPEKKETAKKISGRPNEKKADTDKKSRISERFRKIKDSVKTTGQKIKSGKDKLGSIKAFISDEEVKAMLGEVKIHLLRLFKHASPKKTDLVLSIGFEDPADTGFFLAGISAVYPVYARWLRIDSHFDKKIFKIKGSIRGHFINFHVGWHVLSVIRNKKVRTFLSKNK